MKKLMFAVAICATMIAMSAPDAGMQQAANDPSVAQMAEEDPDGVQMFVGDDGDMKWISTGTGVYDFTDEDEIADARKEATRNAKAHIVKYFKENFSTEEEATNASKKAKSLQSDGENEQISISKEQIKTTVEVIKSNASKILTGIVVIKEQKIPSSKKGGTIRVTVGFSKKTIEAAAKGSNAMTQGVSDQDNFKPTTNGTGNGGNGGSPAGRSNNGYQRSSRTVL